MTKKWQVVLLLLLLILIWGCSWPLMALGVADCPAIWYSTIRLCIAAAVIFIAMLLKRRLTIPHYRDFPLIASIGLFQAGFFVMLITLGLQYVPPGRSAIIAYTFPFFVTPIAVIFFNERLYLGKIIGLLLGLLGIVLLFSPWGIDWHDKNVILGNGLLLLSAISWSFAMLHTRYATWHSTPSSLLPWQLLIAVIPNLGVALWLMPHPVIHITPILLFSLFYVAILGSCLAFWIMTTVTRNLPVVTTSLSLLAVPVLGLLSSALWIGERLTTNIVMSMGLILTGLIFVSLSGR